MFSGDGTILLHEPAKNRWLRFAQPREILIPASLAEVVPMLERLQEQVEGAGLYAAGFVSYEAAPAFDPAFRVKADSDFPLAWFGLFEQWETCPGPLSGGPRARPDPAAKDGLPWRFPLSADEYGAALGRIKHYIRAGDTYQVNYTLRLNAPAPHDAFPLFAAMVEAQGPHFSAFIDTERFCICSASPELSFRLDGADLVCRPMKGTAPRGLWPAQDRLRRTEMLLSDKNRAENIMIVDMVRNDLGRVAEVGTVSAENLFQAELFDQSVYIRNSIKNLQHEALMGAGLAVLVILIFLRNLRSTIIVSLSIPISIVCAFVLLYFNNLSLNVFTLGGLALGVGRLVDDSIVELENIHRHLAMGQNRREAVLNAAQEVAMPIFVSTVTTIVVFFPVVFLMGVARNLFMPLALTIAFALVMSFFVSRTVTPLLCLGYLETGRANGFVRLGEWLAAPADMVNSAGSVTANAITAASLTQVAGSATTTLNGAVDTNTPTGVSLTGTNLSVNAGTTTTAGGVVTINESGTVTIAVAGDIIGDGYGYLLLPNNNDNQLYVMFSTLIDNVRENTGQNQDLSTTSYYIIVFTDTDSAPKFGNLFAEDVNGDSKCDRVCGA